MNSSEDHTVLEKSLDDLESIQMEDEVKNVLVTLINLVVNSGDAKAVVRHLWKAVDLTSYITTKFNVTQPIKIIQWKFMTM
jgi:hypothetical protein